MRQCAIELGLTLNEYGLYSNNGQQIPVATEEDIFNALRVTPIRTVQNPKTINALQFVQVTKTFIRMNVYNKDVFLVRLMVSF